MYFFSNFTTNILHCGGGGGGGGYVGTFFFSSFSVIRLEKRFFSFDSNFVACFDSMAAFQHQSLWNSVLE